VNCTLFFNSSIDWCYLLNHKGETLKRMSYINQATCWWRRHVWFARSSITLLGSSFTGASNAYLFQ